MPLKDPEARRAYARAQSRRYYAAHLDTAREKRRTYNKTQAGKAALARAKTRYLSTEPGKENAREAAARNRALHHDRHQARWALAYAVRTGALCRPETCDGCKRHVAIEAHHHKGYAPEHHLDVRWLCKACHTVEG